MKSPTDIYHDKCAALGISPQRGVTLAEMQSADPLATDGPDAISDTNGSGDCTAQVGELVKSVAIDPNLSVSEKRSKINKALALLDDGGADKPEKPSDGAGDMGGDNKDKDSDK